MTMPCLATLIHACSVLSVLVRVQYNPVGESRLREVFLKYNNLIKGRYLAELTQQVFEDLESNKYQFAEYRLSIYGAKTDEWQALAAWVVDHNLFSSNVRWMIQVPRLYSIYKASGQISNFAQMLSSQIHTGQMDWMPRRAIAADAVFCLAIAA